MEFSNTLSSDALIYNILSNSDDSVIIRHKIAFTNPYGLENEEDYILINHVSNQYGKQTNESDHFLATVELIITNRNTDYEIANEAINLCIKHIKKVLRSSNEIKRRQLKILNSVTSYDDNNSLNRNLILQFNEMDIYDSEENIGDLDILFGEVELDA